MKAGRESHASEWPFLFESGANLREDGHRLVRPFDPELAFRGERGVLDVRRELCGHSFILSCQIFRIFISLGRSESPRASPSVTAYSSSIRTPNSPGR